ncbi:Long-chain-alcohol O-fatty-acyltransferase [Bertholletia excelsa]
MDEEIKNFVVVWLGVLFSLTYCHTLGKFIPGGGIRFLAIFPIICLFFYLPLNLTTVILGAPSCFLISWLATFKLLLFAFGKGPLSLFSSHRPISLPLFTLIACLPIRVQHHPSPPNPEKSQSNPVKKIPATALSELPVSPQNFATKFVLGALGFQLYPYKEHLHPYFMILLLCFHVYMGTELMLALMAVLARAVAGLDLELHFNEPLLSRSLQDFWARRWNLTVSSILRPTVYNPVKSLATPLMGKRLAPMAALILYNVDRRKPTWEVTCFFVIHGACLAVEIWIKKALNGRYNLPSAISGPLVVLFAVVTGSWLFILPIQRCGADVRVGREMATVLHFVKGIARV